MTWDHVLLIFNLLFNLLIIAAGAFIVWQRFPDG